MRDCQRDDIGVEAVVMVSIDVDNNCFNVCSKVGAQCECEVA